MAQYDLKPWFKKYFPPAHPEEVAYGYLSRDISRTFFEFLRNLLVVGAVKVIANATGNVIVATVYYVSVAAMVMFFYSFIVQFDVAVFAHFTQRSWAKVLDALLSLTFAIICTFASMWLVHTVAAEIVKARTS